MPNRYTCFVISPIGEEGSETRELADQAFQLIIQPSLVGFDMTVERADHIRGIEDTITKEMVERIQQSDLCVVNLTGSNPNVMYECGRRHETGKPVIMLTQEERLPFDVVTHPVIRYSLDLSGRELVNLHARIRGEVQHYFDSGFERFGAKTIDELSRELASLSGKIDIILRRVSASATTPQPGLHTDVAGIIRKLGGVIPATNWAFTQQDSDLLDKLLPMAPNKDTDNYVLGGLVQGVLVGSRVAFDRLQEVVATELDRFEIEDSVRIISGLAFGASRFGQAETALPVVADFAQTLEKRSEDGEGVELKIRAQALNAWQRLLHSTEQYRKALQISELVLALAPDEPSYLYNHSLNAEGAGDLETCDSAVDRYVAILAARGFENPDDDHLVHAIKTYARRGRCDDARAMYAVLEQNYELLADVVRNDPEVEACLG